MVGGVVGLSFAGLSRLPLSSVMPGPLPVPDTLSEPEAMASMLDLDETGTDVLCESFALKRLLLAVVEGADLRLVTEGAEYECEYGSTAVCGGGEVRPCRVRRIYDERSSYDRVFCDKLSSLVLIGPYVETAVVV